LFFVVAFLSLLFSPLPHKSSLAAAMSFVLLSLFALTLAQLLEREHNALMSVFDGLGSFSLQQHALFLMVRFCRMQLDHVPAIQFIIQLC
jgi:hypothetical protein